MFQVLKRLCERGQACSCFIDRIKIFRWTLWDWKECCREHDLDYIEQRTKSKLIADNKLYRCVRKKAFKALARAMYKVVRTSKRAKGYWDAYRAKKM